MFRPTTVVLPIGAMAVSVAWFLLMIDLSINTTNAAAGNRNAGETQVNTNLSVTNGNTNEAVFCAQDVQACPDGSFISRQPPTCAFADCPEVSANVNTGTASPRTVQEVTSNASRYDGREICIRGDFQSSFEFYAFVGGWRVDANGRTPEKPYIWNEVPVSEEQLACETLEGGDKVCTGTITSCGVFGYDPDSGFGHVGAYMFQLVPAR